MESGVFVEFLVCERAPPVVTERAAGRVGFGISKAVS